MYFISALILLVFVISFFVFRHAILDMKRLSDQEAWNLKIGDVIRTKTEGKEIAVGRIVMIWYDAGCGVLKEVTRPHQAHYFEFKDIRKKL